MQRDVTAELDGTFSPSIPTGRIARLWTAANVWERCAFCVWAAILAAVCTQAFICGWLRPGTHSVYPIFARAARDWLSGADMYSYVYDPYRYSPLVAVLLVPFSLLPDAVGGVLWRLLNGGVYLAALAWWSRAVVPQELTRSQRALLFLLVVPLSIGSLHNGQSNALVLGLVLAAIAGVAERRWNLAALCAALACLFKLYPIAIGLLLAILYPRRFACRLGAALALGLGLPFLLQQPDYVGAQYASWVHLLRVDDRQNLSLLRGYQDLRMFFRVWLVPLGPQTYLVIQLAVAAGIALVCLAGQRAAWPRRLLLSQALALGCCWMTVCGAATESCTYILVAPALSWALLEAWLTGRSWCFRGILLAGYALTLLARMFLWSPATVSWTTLGPLPAAALLLLGCQAWLAWRPLRAYETPDALTEPEDPGLPAIPSPVRAA